MPAIQTNDDQLIFNTDKIEEITEKADNGFKITRQEKFWFSNIQPVRKANLVFKRTTDETIHYLKCKLGVCTEGKPFLDPETQTLKQEGIEYFSEMFCKIKREDGSVGKMKLRDYQEDVLNLYMKNRFSILIASRQIGKCVSMLSQITLQDQTTLLEYHTKFYQLVFDTKPEKTIYDYIKYGLYSMIDFIN